MFSSVANIFKISDLRNKILFVVAMVGVYRLGVFIRVPGVDSIAIEQLRDTANQQGALGFLNLFSGGAFESFSIFALGIMPYITASIIMQVLGVVIPKLEELQQEGAVGQRKITQYTRYVTIGLATLQATGLVFIFGTGRGTAYFGAGANAPTVPLLPDGVWPRGYLIIPMLVAGTAVLMWISRADLPARHRQRHVDDHLRVGRVGVAAGLLQHPGAEQGVLVRGDHPADDRRSSWPSCTSNSGNDEYRCSSRNVWSAAG